jgi:hypothetical protein
MIAMDGLEMESELDNSCELINFFLSAPATATINKYEREIIITYFHFARNGINQKTFPPISSFNATQ